MKFSKITMVGTAVAFLSMGGFVKAAEDQKNTDTKQEEIQRVLGEFEGIKKCDPSERAENICKKNCTGEGYLWGKGTCSQQEVFDKCSSSCRADWIADCVSTATNKTNNLKVTDQCK